MLICVIHIAIDYIVTSCAMCSLKGVMHTVSVQVVTVFRAVFLRSCSCGYKFVSGMLRISAKLWKKCMVLTKYKSGGKEERCKIFLHLFGQYFYILLTEAQE